MRSCLSGARRWWPAFGRQRRCSDGRRRTSRVCGTVDLVAALAYADAPLTAHLGTVRQWALDLVDLTARPDHDSFDDHDALTRAINDAHGRGLEAVLALGHWEFRATGSIHPDFTALLDDVLNVPAPIGMEYRSILAQRRVVLEVIARDWLEDNTSALFGDHDLGLETFDLTLKYSGQATPWLYERLRDQLLGAARRQDEHAARWLALATLHAIPGYGADDILAAFGGDIEAISAFAEEIAFLVQDSDAGTPQLDAAVGLWHALLDANRTIVPAQALRSSGRWAFVTGLAEKTWAEFMLRTLELTGDTTDFAIEIADRCRTAPAPGDSTKILLHLLEVREPWERDYVAHAALDALRALSRSRHDGNFHPLRTRLTELGHHDATDITPYQGPQGD